MYVRETASQNSLPPSRAFPCWSDYSTVITSLAMSTKIMISLSTGGIHFKSNLRRHGGRRESSQSADPYHRHAVFAEKLLQLLPIAPIIPCIHDFG